MQMTDDERRAERDRQRDLQTDAEARREGLAFSPRPHYNEDGSVNFGTACMQCKAVLGGSLVPDECPECGAPFRHRLTQED